MEQLPPLFLTIHILTAIVAFGPTFAFPLIARMAADEPRSGLFALRVMARIQKVVVIPGALTMPISGLLLVWSEGIDLAGTHWLLLAIGLYVVAIAYSIGVQLRTLGRMIVGAQTMAAGRAVLAAGPGAALARPVAGAAAAPAHEAATQTVPAASYANPAAEMAALGARVRNGGILLAILIVVIVSLMAGKPAI